MAEHVGLPLNGQMGVAGSINIVFEADLAQYVADRPSVLYWVLQPGAEVSGIGAGLVRMVRPWRRFVEIEEGGVLLVRPDNYVAFRQSSAPANGTAADLLGAALRQILDRE